MKTNTKFSALLLILCCGTLLGLATARAAEEDPDEKARLAILAMSKTKPPTLTRAQENKALNDLEKAKRNKGQEKGEATSTTPGGRSSIETNAPGTLDDLQFGFLDANGNPVTTPTIGSVLYEVNTNPFSTMFSPIGTSTDSSTDFALDFVLPPGELLIRAIPFDLAGSPFDFPDLTNPAVNLAIGYVENIPVIEPSSAALIGLGIVVTAGLARRNRRK